jgi:hypothetical protein
LTVAVRIDAHELHLRYAARGDLTRLRLPPLAPSARADELWRDTCFELFATHESHASYREFNFQLPPGRARA